MRRAPAKLTIPFPTPPNDMTYFGGVPRGGGHEHVEYAVASRLVANDNWFQRLVGSATMLPTKPPRVDCFPTAEMFGNGGYGPTSLVDAGAPDSRAAAKRNTQPIQHDHEMRSQPGDPRTGTTIRNTSPSRNNFFTIPECCRRFARGGFLGVRSEPF